MINNKPNIFEFATKELSQDAVFCYILDCFNSDNTKRIAVDFLNLIEYPHSDKIKKINIIRQEDHIDIKAELLLSDETRNFIIIEDKVFSTLHNNQLLRYKENTIKRENCSESDIFGIFFKIGVQTISEKTACEEAKFKNLSYIDFNNYLYQVAVNDYLLNEFQQFFQQRISFCNIVDDCDFSNIDKDMYQTMMQDRYGQRKIAKWLFKEIFEETYNENKMYNVNNYGSTCTQYRFIFDKKSSSENWNLKPDEFPTRNYACFFRIDRNKNGWYVAIRHYFENGSNNDESKDSIQKRERIFKEINITKDDAPNTKASKEKTLLLFNVDSIDAIKQLIPNFKIAVRYLLNCLS